MSDDSKPKGPILPGTTKPTQEGEASLIRKISNKVVDIGKEKPTDSKKIKEKKRTHQQERNKRKAKQTVEKVDKVEKATPEESLKEIHKKEREKHNDKEVKEKIRGRQQKQVKLPVVALPNNTTSAGNNPIKLPVHPLTVNMRGMPPKLDPRPEKNEFSQPVLQNQLQHRLTQQKTNTNTMTPKPRPPGG